MELVALNVEAFHLGVADFDAFLVGSRVAFWAAFRAIVGAAVLIIADQFLLLGIDRDDGLPRSLCRNDFRVDVLELGIPIGGPRSTTPLQIRRPPATPTLPPH